MAIGITSGSSNVKFIALYGCFLNVADLKYHMKLKLFSFLIHQKRVHMAIASRQFDSLTYCQPWLGPKTLLLQVSTIVIHLLLCFSFSRHRLSSLSKNTLYSQSQRLSTLPLPKISRSLLRNHAPKKSDQACGSQHTSQPSSSNASRRIPCSKCTEIKPSALRSSGRTSPSCNTQYYRRSNHCACST